MAEIVVCTKQLQCLRDNKASRVSGSRKVICRNPDDCPGKAKFKGSVLCFMPMVDGMFASKLPAAVEQAYEKACKQP